MRTRMESGMLSITGLAGKNGAGVFVMAETSRSFNCNMYCVLSLHRGDLKVFAKPLKRRKKFGLRNYLNFPTLFPRPCFVFND